MLSTKGPRSALTAIVFSVICWIVFGRIFDVSDPSRLPTITRNFLAIQPWWLAAGLFGVMANLMPVTHEQWRPWQRVYNAALMIANLIGMAWGIIAIFVLSLPPAGI